MVCLRKISLAESRGSSRFFNNKVVSDFNFRHFLKKNYLVLPSLTKFLSQRGNPRIQMKLFSRTLFALVSLPLQVSGVTLQKIQTHFQPAVQNNYIFHTSHLSICRSSFSSAPIPEVKSGNNTNKIYLICVQIMHSGSPLDLWGLCCQVKLKII